MISPQVDLAINMILTIALVVAIIMFVKNRKVTGKAMIPSICLFMTAFVILIGLWFDLLGLINTFISIVLLSIGAYFMKYLPVNRK